MRRNYISPEFKYNHINGTMNMGEQTSFFGSKMLDIQDSISISTENIIYYQSLEGEQLNFYLEKSLDPIAYNTVDDKMANHTIKSDDSQSPSQYSSNTRWIIYINIKSILTNYLFATLKKYRTFEGVRKAKTINNNVDSSVFEYISKNILSRYKYKSIDFYIDYIPFSQDGTIQYQNEFTENATSITPKIQTILDDNQSVIKIIFNQEKPSSNYNFKYYFNIHFDKI